MHGGNALQVRAAAERRLATMVNPALAAMTYALKPQRRREHLALQIRVAEKVLELNSIGKKAEPPAPFAVPNVPGASITAQSRSTTIRVEALTNEDWSCPKPLW